MIPHHVYYQLVIVGLLWLCIMLHSIWPSRDAVFPQLRTEPVPLRFKRKRANEPKPFAGLTQRPHCAACAHDAKHPQVPPPQRPEPMPSTNRRPCAIDTSRHFCPHAGCDYREWLGLGNLRANGHPSGGLWPYSQKTQTHHFRSVYGLTVARSSSCNPPRYSPYSLPLRDHERLW